VPEVPERPEPPQPWRARLVQWCRWVGTGRLATGSVLVVVVLLVAYWLVKPPQVSSGVQLPVASRRTSTSSGSVPIALVTTATAPTAEVVVDVAGAVRRGGVYRLPSGARVVDALRAAGGCTPDANRDAVNLAALVTDGERIYLPRIGEPPPPVEPPPTVTTTPGPVNINTASEATLDRLPGIGPATAAAIVAHRMRYGRFASVDDLASVHGIGPSKLEALRGLVTV